MQEAAASDARADPAPDGMRAPEPADSMTR